LVVRLTNFVRIPLATIVRNLGFVSLPFGTKGEAHNFV
jgi:hypothetical protein